MQIDNDMPMPGGETKAQTPRVLCVFGPLHGRHVITTDDFVLVEGGAYELEKSATVTGDNVFVWRNKDERDVQLLG